MKFIQCVHNSNEGVSPKESIEAIKKAGFDGVFLQWYDKDWEFSQEEQLKFARELGLKIEFCHLKYKGINDIWVEGKQGETLVTNYLQDLDECHKYGVDTVVMHLTSKSIAPQPSEVGIKRFQTIVDYAQNLGIKIAFENTKIFGYLEYLFDHIKNDNIGICFDAGHCHCHFDDNFSWDKFEGKILAVHLHDNDKSDDLHLLPFDGTIDWKDYMKKLKSCGYKGPITLESCYRYHYLNESLEDFYKESYEKTKELEKIFNEVE